MSRVGIVTDSTSLLPPELIAEYGIRRSLNGHRVKQQSLPGPFRYHDGGFLENVPGF